MSKEQSEKLCMNHRSACTRLTRDLLFKYIIKAGHKCFRCGGELTRETFSIDHKVSWLHGENPPGLFFDLDNIAFSHLKCNIGAVDRKKPWTLERRAARAEQTREQMKKQHAEGKMNIWTPERRAAKVEDMRKLNAKGKMKRRS